MSSTPSRPGWHPHPYQAGKYGYFNGKEWGPEVRDQPPQPRGDSARAPQRKMPMRPMDLIFLAIVVAFGSGVLVAIVAGSGMDDEGVTFIASVAFGLTSIMLLVGCIAEGVRRGILTAERDRLKLAETLDSNRRAA